MSESAAPDQCCGRCRETLVCDHGEGCLLSEVIEEANARSAAPKRRWKLWHWWTYDPHTRGTSVNSNGSVHLWKPVP